MPNMTLFHFLSQHSYALVNSSNIFVLLYVCIALVIGLRTLRKFADGENREVTDETALAVLHLLLALAAAWAPTHG